jgi:ketosteroid isomerase-like protein
MTIESALQDLYRAMLAHDIAALDALLTDDTVYVHSTGLAETKTAFLQGVRDGLYEYQVVRPISERIQQSGDIAVVYTVLDFQGGPRGQTHPPVTLITTLVWALRDNAWRMTVRQATRLP